MRIGNDTHSTQIGADRLRTHIFPRAVHACARRSDGTRTAHAAEATGATAGMAGAAREGTEAAPAATPWAARLAKGTRVGAMSACTVVTRRAGNTAPGTCAVG